MSGPLVPFHRSASTAKLRQQILADPYYRFRSLPEVQLAAELGVRIDVNRAGIDDWLRLPGLSIHQARTLVQLTQGGVQFYALEDLAAVLNLPVNRLQPWTPILQFCFYDPEGVDTVTLVNPNNATVEELQSIPHLSAAMAHAIVRDRISTGPFRHLADLQQRLRLSGQAIQALLPYLRF